MSVFASKPTGIVLQPATAQAIQFRDDAGNDIVLSQMDVLTMICPNATPQEATYFLEMCRAQRLNPFIKEAFLVKYNGHPATMQVAEIVFERRANAHPDYLGMESGVVFIDANGQIRKREGTATYKAANEVLIGGWAKVHRRGRSDSYAEVSLDEYDKHQSLWKSMPGVMVNKCAKSVALRLAFPSDFQGMYVAEEIDQAPSIEALHAEVVSESHADVHESEPEAEISHASEGNDKQSEFNQVVANLASLRGVDEVDVVDAILGSKAVVASGYTSGNGLTDDQMDIAIAQARAWLSKVEEPTYETEDA